MTAPSGGGRDPPAPSGAIPRILIADDDRAVRGVFSRLLRRRYDVQEARDGAEVIARIEAGEMFDALLLDLEMPRMNGRRTFEALGVLSPTLARRTLVVTAGATSAGLQKWLNELPPGRVLLKPFGMATLFVTIERLLCFRLRVCDRRSRRRSHRATSRGPALGPADPSMPGGCRHRNAFANKDHGGKKSHRCHSSLGQKQRSG